MKIDRIILCGNNGANEIYIEFNLPMSYTGEVSFNFGQGGLCGAWKKDQTPLEKKYLDILKNSVMLASNTS